MTFETFQEAISKLPIDIIISLKNTNQNSKYHPEGNVYNHTWLVYDSILKSDLEDNLKNDLLICATFHDLGKIRCTRLKEREDGTTDIVAYGHENYAKEYLDKHLCNFKFFNKEMIYEVCENHMRAHLLSKMKESKIKEFSLNKYYNETILFSKFDDIGKNKIQVFIMTIGIPGSGKSTWIKEVSYKAEVNISFSGPFTVVCPDLVRKEVTGQVSDISQDGLVWKIVKERTIDYLNAGYNVILDSTMVKSRSRKDFLKHLPLCLKYAKIFECELDTAYMRVTRDIKQGIDRSNVPSDVVFKMFENFKNDYDKIHFDGLEIIE